MKTYKVTFWLDNGERKKRTTFNISISPGEDVSEAAISQMPDWILDEGWEIEDSKYVML
jgi:hypothetical protein